MAIGKKTGGRKKGTPNKATAALAEDLAAGGEMPRDYMLRVMRDAKADDHRRDEMAKAVAPFVHAKLAAVAHEHSGPDGGPIELDLSPVEIGRRIAFALARAKRSTQPPKEPTHG